MTLEKKLTALLKDITYPVNVLAYELRHDGEGWSANGRFRIASKVETLTEVLEAARGRWEVFKVNYCPGARVKDLTDVGSSDGERNLECDCTPFIDITETREN